jgi:hypothetical protein
MVMQVAALPELATEIKQAALVSLSQEITRRWPTEQNHKNALSAEDCRLVRDNLFEAVYYAYRVPILFKIYRNIIRVVALQELPKGWDIVELLSQGFHKLSNLDEAMGLVNFVLALVCCYEYSYVNERKPLTLIQRELFPPIRKVITLASQPALVNLALKIFYKSFKMVLDVGSEPEVEEWMPIILRIMACPDSPDPLLPKIRKEAFKILARVVKHCTEKIEKKDGWA